MDDSYESVLFIARETYLYQIPPRTSSEGYRASFWGDMVEPLWKGRLRVLEKGLDSETTTKAFVRLEDSNTGELFAVCPYQPTKVNPNGGVEAVLDSSRYFVLTLLDQESGSKAYLGMGFPERSESFDFNCALQDWSKRQNPTPIPSSSSSSSSTSVPSPHAPTRDFSLKPGQTLNVKIGGLPSTTHTKKSTTSTSTSTSSGGGMGFLLPPPPPPAPRTR